MRVTVDLHPLPYRELRRCRVGIIVYVLAVVGALTLVSCLALGIGLALDRRSRSREDSGHAPGGRLLPPPDGPGRPTRGVSGRW
jgi:hypothetical protein